MIEIEVIYDMIIGAGIFYVIDRVTDLAVVDRYVFEPIRQQIDRWIGN